MKTIPPSARVPYGSSRRPFTASTPTPYQQAQAERRRLPPQTQRQSQRMNDERELAKALALLALPNR